MGDRGQVKVLFKDYPPVYLYTHWSALELEETVAAALFRGKDRWGDTSYLARIIFSEMIKRDIDGESGFGIQPYEQGDAWLTIIVDDEKETVTVSGTNSDGTKSYKEFIKSKLDMDV